VTLPTSVGISGVSGDTCEENANATSVRGEFDSPALHCLLNEANLLTTQPDNRHEQHVLRSV
jgi:hypothetical protein